MYLIVYNVHEKSPVISQHVNDEIFYMCLTFGSNLLVIWTSFS